MINRDTMLKYVKITSGYGADPNLTLVDFSLDEEQRNIINLVNNTAKNDKKLAKLLDDLKYSNNKIKVIDEYFGLTGDSNNTISNFNKSNYGRINVNDYGFINMSSLISIVGITTAVISLAVLFGTK